jgi:hypothetical protein
MPGAWRDPAKEIDRAKSAEDTAPGAGDFGENLPVATSEAFLRFTVEVAILLPLII